MALTSGCFDRADAPEPFGHLRDLTDDELVASVLDADRERARLEAREGALLAELDRRHAEAKRAGDRRRISPDVVPGGAANPFRFPSAAHWMAAMSRGPRPALRRLLNEGRDLHELPLVQAALADGRITRAHAAQILVAWRKFPAEAVQAQPTLLEWAATMQWPQFVAATRALCEIVDDTDPAETALRNEAKCGISVTEFDGLAEVRMITTTDRAHRWLEVAEAEARKLFADDHAELVERVGPDAPLSQMRRTPNKRLHDAFDALLTRGAHALAPRSRGRIGIVIDNDTFEREAARLATGNAPKLTLTEALDAATRYRCHSTGGLPLNRAVAVAEALLGHVRRVIVDARTGRTDISADARFFAGDDRDALIVRDRWCATPGCGHPAAASDMDHVLPKARGGPTLTTNGEARCPFCHRWKTLLETMGLL